MSLRFFIAIASIFLLAGMGLAQNSNQSTQTTRRRAATKTQSAVVSGAAGESGVVDAFDALISGIERADVKAVTSIYWNSPKLIVFNNNGTVTKGWDTLRKNRESSYPQLKKIKIDVRDRHVEMMGPNVSLVTWLWNQSDIYRGSPETASGRTTIVFRRIGGAWKAVHVHTSPDNPDPSRVAPSEQTPNPEITPRRTPSPGATTKPR